MDHQHTWSRAVRSLRKAPNDREQCLALQHCRLLPIKRPAELIEYMDALLFTLAFPYSEGNYRMAMVERERLHDLLFRKQSSSTWQHALEGSGLPFSVLRCQFSADLASWFLEKFPEQVGPDEAQADHTYLSSLMQSVLPGIEFHDATQGKHTLWSRVRLLSRHRRNQAGLRWLLDLIKQQNWNPPLSDILYDQLKIFIRWNIGDSPFARTHLRIPVSVVHYRRPGSEPANSLAIIRQPLGKPLRLSEAQKHDLIAVARVSLACYLRETDPVTYADPAETFLYDMGHGLHIAVMGMNRSRVLALESYVGFMAFKNGIPVSYGGGWVFGYRCKIGVNIYPPFRGAGSDQLFCQVLRLYHQLFRIKKFVVKPYQFGKGNPEGLKSGAFWFYYRLGFRPVRDDIREQAAAEWKKLQTDPSYRTPVHILRQFTACNKEWEPVPNRAVMLDADRVSMAVSRMIVARFGGNRALAVASAKKDLSRFLGKKLPKDRWLDEDKIWTNWALLMSLIEDKSQWTLQDKVALTGLISERISGSEHAFIRKCQQHIMFWKSLAACIH